MSKMFEDIFKYAIVEIVKWLIFSGFTILSGKLINYTFEISIDSRIIFSIIVFLIFIGLISFIRKVKIKTIDNIQEDFLFFFTIATSDIEMEKTNKQELYKIGIQDNSDYRHQKNYTVLNVSGPLCPECELALKEKRTFWGKYKHFCPRGHVSFVNKYTNYSLSEHIKNDTRKEIKEENINLAKPKYN